MNNTHTFIAGNTDVAISNEEEGGWSFAEKQVEYETEKRVEYEYGQQPPASSTITTGGASRTSVATLRSPLRRAPAFTEVILNWWIGEVHEIHDDYFVATMIDVEGKESFAEFDLDSVREEDRVQVQLGASFAFAITRQDCRDGRHLDSKMEFLEPYIWTAQDEERATTVVREHFPETSAFDN